MFSFRKLSKGYFFSCISFMEEKESLKNDPTLNPLIEGKILTI
jgi:hypothetical protein